MRLLFNLSMAFLIHLSWGLPKDTVIQYKRTGVVSGEETFEESVFVNGVPVTRQDKDSDINLHAIAISPDNNAYFYDTLKIIVESFNHSVTRNHTYVRVRKCKLNGYQVLLLSDRLQYDGKDYLTLDQTTDTWTAVVPEALPLKQQWDRERERTSRERMRLQEGCAELMKELSHSENSSGELSVSAVLAPVLAAMTFVGMVLMSFIISKRQDLKGSGHPGGVLGSIIHYPALSSGVPCEVQRKPSASHLLPTSMVPY